MSNLSKRVWAEFNKLKRLDRNSNSSTKFIIDSSPFDDEESPSSNYNFLGRLLPMSDPLNQTALKIEIKITNEYPGKPPEVRILTPMHHPNVLENGFVCLAILSATESWKASLFLDDVLKELLEVIDRPNLNIPVNDDVANEYLYKKTEYDRKVLTMIQENKISRI